MLSYKEISRNLSTHRRASDPALACLLFNLALEKVIRDSGIERRGTIFHKSIQILGYADDLDIVGRSERSIRDAFTSLDTEAQQMGLKINESKTKYMEVTRKPSKIEFFEIAGYKFKKVTEFKYLGSLITSDNNMSTEIHHRLLTANRCYYGLQKQLRSHHISLNTKKKLYKTLIRPVLLYGSETWAVGNTDRSRLDVFERKVLRTIYGPVNDDGCWRKRHNHEVYKLYRDPDVCREIKARRVRWLGHILRKDEADPCRKLTLTSPYGTRRVGRPQLRWLDEVEKDIMETGIQGWKIKAQDRDVWRSVVGLVRAGTRL